MPINDFDRVQALLVVYQFKQLIETIQLLDPEGAFIGACLHTKSGLYRLIHDTTGSGPRLVIRISSAIDRDGEQFELSFRRKVGAPPYVAGE
jgi:hypothetical protein